MDNKETQKEAPKALTYGKSKRDQPATTTVTTPGSSDYIRLRGLREHGYYILVDD